MNPLLHHFNTAPFSKISNDDFKPAIKKAIKIAKEEINTIVKNSEKPTFENTIVPLDFSGEKLLFLQSLLAGKTART